MDSPLPHEHRPAGARALVLATMTVLGLVTPRLEAATLTVQPGGPGQNPINAAIQQAQPGDILDIQPGAYTECIVLTKKLHLRGAGRDTTTIRCNQDTQTLRIEGVEAVVEGLTLQYTGAGQRAIVYLRCANATLKSNRIMAGNLAGVQADGCSPVIQDNLIDGNKGSGMVLTRQCTARVHGNEVRQNARNGIAVTASSPDLSGNTVHGNSGDGLTFTENAAGPALRNIISRNGGAGARVSGSSPLIAENEVADNGQSGVIFEEKAQGRLERNVIHHNALHGIVVKGSSSPAIQANTVAENAQVGLWVQEESRPEVARNLIVLQSGKPLGVGIQTTASGRKDGAPVLRDNWLWGNTRDCVGITCAAGQDPGFVNTAGRDYHLKPGSPALGSSPGAGYGAYGNAP